ncbi:SRPBCC family protein [Nonomuraea zeae]|uniref:SRPBCC family protein n=2 Tax=Nonomuraea zeae TaxID=1642303 RepID=A0A5S4G4C1_9ACTN|nr:SRPBCC family protein [Nonomuraea zeae]
MAAGAARRGQEAVKDTPADKAVPGMPTDQLKSALKDLAVAAAERALTSVTGKVEGLSGRLGGMAEGGGSNLLGAITGSGKSVGGSALAGAAKGAIKGIFSRKGKGKGGKKLKVTNIVETIDVGAPRRIVYNQWTEFQDFPSFMKKVENVEQKSDEKLAWTAQILWSHRTWRSTIREQVPDERIIWRSEGDKGHVDGAVSFHALTPDFTRVVVILEYHPKGFFEYTGNLWRAQGRRARLELKHFARHVMTQVMQKPEEMEESGWRGEIRDGKIVKDHETAVAEEKEAAEAGEEEDELEQGESEEEPEEEQEEGEEEEPEEEQEEGEEEEPEEEEEEEEEEGEPEDQAEGEEEEPEEEEEEGEEEEPEEEQEEEEEEGEPEDQAEGEDEDQDEEEEEEEEGEGEPEDQAEDEEEEEEEEEPEEEEPEEEEPEEEEEPAEEAPPKRTARAKRPAQRESAGREPSRPARRRSPAWK